MIEKLIQEIRGTAGLLETIQKKHDILRRAMVSSQPAYIEACIYSVIDGHKTSIDFTIEELTNICKEYETAKRWKEFV